MPSAADYDRQAINAAAQARRLRALALSIRSLTGPLARTFDPLASRHLEGVWMSEAAHRSRKEVGAIRSRCAAAHADGYAMAADLDRAADGLELDARAAERRAAFARAQEAADE